jgi:hypothetical protein
MAIPELYKGLKQVRNDYGKAFVATYREAKLQANDPADIPFSKARLVHHGGELVRLGISARKLVVKNFPDALYTFRARADLPAEILHDGHFAIVGRGKGLYAFLRIPQPNRFRLPTRMESVRIQNQVPEWVRQYMGNDEQGMLARIQANDLISKYLDLDESFRLQSHLRMSVAKYGQVEVDELYIGRTKMGDVGIAVEAKNEAPDDCLNVSQLFGTAQALMRLFPPTMPRYLIGAKPDTSGRICLAQFTVADHPAKVKAVRKWCAFELL